MKLARRAQEWLKLQIRRSLLLILNIVFNNALGYRLLGWLNRRIGFLGSVFLAYPGRRDLAFLYGHSLLWKWFRWRPALIGVFREGDLWGLTLAVTSVQRELCDSSNHSRLMDLLERIDKIQAILRAPHRTLAGVLPSLLSSRGVPSEGRESERAAICLERALHEVALREGLGEDTPIIVLGASGFVGSKLVPLLSGKQLYLVDLVPDQKTGTGSWPTHLAREASRAILVNVSTSGASCPSRKPTLAWRRGLERGVPIPQRAHCADSVAQGSQDLPSFGSGGLSDPSIPRRLLWRRSLLRIHV